MSREPIRINSDDEVKIASLYGIGKKLAERIVQERSKNVIFAKPDDLTQIDGISLELAITLSPHIDWSIPNQDNQTQTRNWFFGILFFFLSIYIIYPVFKINIHDITSIFNPKDWNWFDFLQITVTPIGKISASSVLLFFGISNLATTPQNTKKYLLASLYSGGGWLISKSILALSDFLLIPTLGWRYLLGYSEFWIDWLLLISAIVITLPLIVVIRPQLRYNKGFTTTFNIAMIFAGLISGTLIWLSKDYTPLWFLILLSIFGVLQVYLGIRSIRFRESLFEIGYGNLLDEKKQTSYEYWLNWINSRLPDPKEQMILKNALEKAYPPSRTQTITSILLIGIGGWIISTVLGAVVQWFVEKGLENLFH